MTEQKKQGVMVLLPIMVCLMCTIAASALCIYEYRRTTFEHISQFCQVLIENDVQAEDLVLSSLKEYHELTGEEIGGNEFLAQYGYRSSEFCEGSWKNFIVPALISFLVTACTFLISAWYMSRRNRIRIAELTKYLEQVNVGASGTIIQAREDGFSQLQDEIYKTVTMLYQTRDAAVRGRADFADNLANIAHQLKTPITAAYLSLQLMKKNSPNAYTKQIEKQLEHLDRLEESLLTLSKIDAGALQLERSPVDIYTALSLASENLDALLLEKEILVEIPDNGCVEIWGDLEWTMEALINLLKNCIEHSPKGGTIHCDYSGNPIYAEILIWDEGEGFKEEDIPHLFERFYRGEEAAGNGMGIGLYMAASIFELQNGTVTARNLPCGGACFEIKVYSH